MSDGTIDETKGRAEEAAGDLTGDPTGDKLGVGEPDSDRQERARKIDPRYVEGDLVRVAGAMHQAEAEFVQGLLLAEGIPSMLQPARGFDVPDMLAAGPRDIMVPAAGQAAARAVLLQAEVAPDQPIVARPTPRRVRAALAPPARVLVALLEAMRIFPPSGGV